MTPFAQQLAATSGYIGLSDADLALLRRAAPLLLPCLPAMADRFYDLLKSYSEASHVFSDQAQIERLMLTLQQWAKELLMEDRDAAYLEKRRRIGDIHVHYSIEPRLIVGAMGQVRRFFLEKVCSSDLPHHEAIELALDRALDLDLMIMTESYHEAAHRRDLDAAAERLRGVLETAPIAICGYDISGSILHWNPAAAKLYGIAPEEAIGRPFSDAMGLEEEALRRTVDEVFAGKGRGPVEESHRNAAGALIRAVVVHTPVPGDVGIAEGVSFALDVSEPARLREVLIEREKMAALGTLAAGLAHEVGNPLSSLSAITQLLESKGADARLPERVRMLREAVERIDGIVRRFLDFTRREEASSVPLAGLVREVLEFLEHDPRLAEVDISSEIPLDGTEVAVPRNGLAQVLINLVINAAEAYGAGRARGRIEIRAERRKRTVALTVTDTGPGFSDDAIRRGFEPFFSTKPTGSGLGLSISYGIIERAGGGMKLSNATEKGGGRVELNLPISFRTN